MYTCIDTIQFRILVLPADNMSLLDLESLPSARPSKLKQQICIVRIDIYEFGLRNAMWCRH